MSDNTLRDEKSSFYSLICTENTYAIDLLLNNNIININNFMDVLKQFYSKYNTRCCYCYFFTIYIIDLVIDFADNKLINLLLRTIILSSDTHLHLEYIQKLISHGGKISKEDHVLLNLPNEIIEQMELHTFH